MTDIRLGMCGTQASLAAAAVMIIVILNTSKNILVMMSYNTYLSISILIHLVYTLSWSVSNGLASETLQPRLSGNEVRPPEVERVALISDTHIAGPEYHVNTESNDLDNDSIVRSQMRMYVAARQIAAFVDVHPSPKLLAMVGDVVHNGLHILEEFGVDEDGLKKLFDMDINGYMIAADIFKSIDLPKIYVWGNHDGLMKCGEPEKSATKDMLKQVYQEYFNASVYSSTDILDNWKVISLNSMWGKTWDPISADCNGVLSSFGKEQLVWLDRQLNDTNKHVVLLAHFPPGTIFLNEIEEYKGITDLKSVLEKHDNVKLMLTGHFHKGVSWGSLMGTIPVVTLPSTRYDAENVFALDLYQNGSWSVVDSSKNRDGARCSDWYTYSDETPNGVFEASFRPKDPGNCGYPLVSEEGNWELDPVMSIEEYPSDEEFNPEGSCRFMFAKDFIPTCLEEDYLENGCCDILSKAFWPTSSHPFSLCLCQKEFWDSTVEYFGSNNRNASEVMEQCSQKAFLLYPGSLKTWCSIAD